MSQLKKDMEKLFNCSLEIKNPWETHYRQLVTTMDGVEWEAGGTEASLHPWSHISF